MVSEQDLRSKISCSKMSQGKVLSNPQHLFSCTSRNHGSDDRLKCPLVVEFSEFSGQLHIEEFLDWLIEVERFFEDRNIAKKKQFKFVESKLKGEAWAWWEQLQRMRTRLGKVPIEDWIKMKKYLKRRFLPPDYRDLMFQEFQNCKQLGNSIAVYTEEFYRLQSYIDLNESEAYSISRYKMGLRWIIKKRLSVQSFHSLADLILAAKDIEQLVEREEKSKWMPQTLQDTTKDHVGDLAVSEAQNSYSKENALTPSFKTSDEQNGYGISIPSRKMTKNFAHGMKNEDDVSMQRTEEEPTQHSVFCTGSTAKGTICLLSNAEESSGNTVSYSQVTTLEVRIDKFLEPCNIRTLGAQNQIKVSEKCESRVSSCQTYFDKVFDMTLNHPLLGRPWESYDDTNFWGKNITYYVYMNHCRFLQKALKDDNSEGQEKQEVTITDGREHCSCLTKKERIIFMAKKEEGYLAYSTALISSLLQALKTKFPDAEEILNIPTSVSSDQHEIDIVLCFSFGNLSQVCTEHTQNLKDKLMDLLGMTQITEKISPCAVPVSLVPEKYQSWKMSSKNTKMHLSRYYDRSSIEKRHHRQLITTLKSNLNQLEEVDFQTNGFIRVNQNKWIHIIQISESTSSKHAIFLSNKNDNQMMISLRSKIILSSEYHQIHMPKRSEFPTALMPITTFYKLQVSPGKCTTLPNIILWLDSTSKRYITSNDKGKITTIKHMKALTSIYQEDRNYAFASFRHRHIKTLGSIVEKTTKCILRENYNYTMKREIKRWKIKNKHRTAAQLLQKFAEYLRIQSHFSTVRARGCPCLAREHNIIQREKSCNAREKKVTRNDMWKCKKRISYPIYMKLAKMKHNLQHISVSNLRNSEFFIIIHPYLMKRTRGRVHFKKGRLM